jgi:hypothetical protein
MAAIAPPPAQDRRSVDRRQTDRRQPRTPVIVPSIVLPSEASLPGAYVEGTRSPMFNFVPRTIGRAEDEDLISPLIDVPYDPTMFVLPAGGTWTVPVSSFNTCAYQRIGHLVTFTFYLYPTTIAGTVNYLQVRLPIRPAVRLTETAVNIGTGSTDMLGLGIANTGPGAASSDFVSIYLFSFSTGTQTNFPPGQLAIVLTLAYFV